MTGRGWRRTGWIAVAVLGLAVDAAAYGPLAAFVCLHGSQQVRSLTVSGAAGQARELSVGKENPR